MTVSPELDQRFREAAAREELDAWYDVAESPIGPLLVAASPAGLFRIEFEGDPDAEGELLARTFGARVLRAPARLDVVRRQLDEYFSGERTAFELPLDLGRVRPFQQLVLAELAKVPYGTVTTYGTLARRAGRPKAARAVGTVMNRNPIPIVLPCHRVVGASGALVGYGGGLHRKEALLQLEGVLG